MSNQSPLVRRIRNSTTLLLYSHRSLTHLPGNNHMNDEVEQQRPRLKISMATWVVRFAAVLIGAGWKLVFEPKMQLQRAVEHEGVGQPLPVLELAPLTGASEGLSLEKLRGKVALVNFWGTWCPPCNAEFPHMVELWDEFRGNGQFAMVSVSCT